MDIKQKKGISLIVLVITIVVMIILATVIILSLSGSGIIDNTEEARDKSNEANIKDAAIVAYSEWKTASALGKKEVGGIEIGSDPMNYIKKVLEEAGFKQEERDMVKIENGVIKVDNLITFTIDGIGEFKVQEGTTWKKFVEDKLYSDYVEEDDKFVLGGLWGIENTIVFSDIDEEYSSQYDGYILKEKTNIYEDGREEVLEKIEVFCKSDEIIQKNTTYYYCLNSIWDKS